MFGISLWELASLIIVTLIAVPPSKIPDMVRGIVHFRRKVTDYVSAVKNSVVKDLHIDTPKDSRDE